MFNGITQDELIQLVVLIFITKRIRKKKAVGK